MVDDAYAPLVPDRRMLNEVKFAARDFTSMADDLLRRLKVEYGTVYNDYATVQQGIMLRDLVAWAYAALIWYLDRAASDCFLATARTSAAIERLVEQLTYKMRPAAPASGPVTLIFPTGTSIGFEMKDRWKYSGPNGLLYESYAKVTQPLPIAPGGTLNVEVRQGESRILTYTSNGEKNQTYRLASVDPGRYLAYQKVEVWVDGSLWPEVDFLTFEAIPQYEISYMQNPPVVRFGDGIAGALPPVGAEIKIRYLIIDGDKGNVIADTIKTSVDKLIIAGQPVTFTVTNPDRISGGTNPEDPDSARRWAPQVFAARDSAITQPDYEALSNTFSDPTFGAVAKAYAINPKSSYDDIVTTDLLTQIDSLVTVFAADAAAIETSTNADAASAKALLVNIQSVLTGLETLRGEMYGWAAAAQNYTDSARLGSVDVYSRLLVVTNQGAVVTNGIQTLINDVNSGLSPSEIVERLNSLLVAANSALSEAQQAQTGVLTIQGALDSAAAPLDDLVEALDSGGTMDTSIQSMSSDAESISTLLDQIAADLAQLTGDSAALLLGVEGLIADIRLRISELFSDDCLSNYVQVPILALDLDGNYVAPSIGLMDALQTFLNARKEVTQVVEVVDGSLNLVPANITINAMVRSGYVPDELRSQIAATVRRLMKGRDFNQPLYLSDLYSAIEPLVGLHHVNISMTGPVVIGGNFMTGENQVAVLGALTINLTSEDGGDI